MGLCGRKAARMGGRVMRGHRFSVRLLCALLIAGVLGVRGAPAHAEPALTVGSELDYPPFAMVDEAGRPVGFSIDLFRAVAETMNLEVDFRVGPWPVLLSDLREGRLDALPFVGIFPERDEYLDFSVPIVVTHGAVFVREGGPRVREESDLAPLRVAVMRDDVGHEYARARPWGDDVAAFPSLAEAFDCLAAARCDAVVAPRLQGVLLIDQGGLTGIAPAPLTLEGFSLSYAFAVQAGDADLLASLNGGLAIAIADGTLDRLYEKWLPELRPQTGIPLDVLLPYATGILALFLVIVSVLYAGQRRATALAGARGRSLERQADHLRRLASRLDTERMRAEHARAEADALIKVIPDLFFRLDAEGRYVDVHDPEGLALVPVERLLGQRIEDALPEDTARAARAALERMHETGESQSLEYTLDRPDGPPRHFQARLAPMDDGGSLAVVRDVTEARQREAEVRHAAAALATASAAKSRFLATLSHEFRTPLNAMLGFSDILVQEMFGPVGNDRYREYTRNIHAAGQALQALVDDVMDITHIDSGRVTLLESVVDLRTIVEQKVAVVAPLAAANATKLRVIGPPTPERVWADAEQVQRMVANLLSNAVKFTQGGSVEVSLEDRPDGGVAVTITDTGIGMSADQLAHLGEPFYQSSPVVAREAGGFGLGIALVKEMIALHGGDLDYDSVLDQGTTVRLIFPAGRRLSDTIVNGPRLKASES